jgi:hypothetical protein
LKTQVSTHESFSPKLWTVWACTLKKGLQALSCFEKVKEYQFERAANY